jgi:hypothetical protein
MFGLTCNGEQIAANTCGQQVCHLGRHTMYAAFKAPRQGVVSMEAPACGDRKLQAFTHDWALKFVY